MARGGGGTRWAVCLGARQPLNRKQKKEKKKKKMKMMNKHVLKYKDE